MINLVIPLFLALLVSFIEYNTTKGNMGTVYNGYGAIEGVRKKKSPAPVRYRVLIPWLIPKNKALYLVARFALVLCVFLVADARVLLALLIISTMEYDYWDQYAELLGALLIMTGTVWGAVMGAVIWGLSRETVLLGVLFGPHRLLVAGVGIAVLALVRIVQGKAKLYCERWTLLAYNWPDLKLAWRRGDARPYWSVLWSIGAVLASPLCIPIVAVGWLLGRARETRIFLLCALFMSQHIDRLL